MNNIEDRIKKFSDEQLKLSEEINDRVDDRREDEEVAEPVDVYQQRVDKAYGRRDRKTVYGSSPIVAMAVESIAETLEPKYRAYKKAKKYFKEKGDMEKVDLLRQQYMMESFLPALEAVINQTSPDEVLNSEKALEAFDEWASIPGSEKGFTEGYIKQAYGNVLGATERRSDGTVRNAVGRIRILCGEGQNRAAMGLAKDIVKAIQAGENIASEEDYELLNRVANLQ